MIIFFQHNFFSMIKKVITFAFIAMQFVRSDFNLMSTAELLTIPFCYQYHQKVSYLNR